MAPCTTVPYDPIWRNTCHAAFSTRHVEDVRRGAGRRAPNDTAVSTVSLEWSTVHDTLPRALPPPPPAPDLLSLDERMPLRRPKRNFMHQIRWCVCHTPCKLVSPRAICRKLVHRSAAPACRIGHCANLYALHCCQCAVAVVGLPAAASARWLLLAYLHCTDAIARARWLAWCANIRHVSCFDVQQCQICIPRIPAARLCVSAGPIFSKNNPAYARVALITLGTTSARYFQKRLCRASYQSTVSSSPFELFPSTANACMQLEPSAKLFPTPTPQHVYRKRFRRPAASHRD